MKTLQQLKKDLTSSKDQEKLGPYGCRCQTLAQRMTGDGCDICNPELAKELEQDTAEQALLVAAGEGDAEASNRAFDGGEE